MVDGKRDVEELAKLVSTLGEPEALLTELEATGLIELTQDQPVAPVPQAVAVFPAKAVAASSNGPAPLTPSTLAGARLFTARLLLDLLGPTSEALCLKIEAARDVPEFVTAVVRARDTVRDVKGHAAAVHFIEQVEAHTPSA
ncbi:MAG: hypothetical protein ABIN37_14700 [Burkholderiaceae bacterium]